MKILKKSLFAVAAVTLSVSALANPASTSVPTAVPTAVPTSAAAVAKAQTMNDASLLFIVKSKDGVMLRVRDKELDRPAITNMSGGAKTISFKGHEYDVEKTVVSKYGKTFTVDRIMAMTADDVR